jgi:hypothetical protein
LDCSNLIVDGNVCDREVVTTFTQGQGIYCEWYNYDDDALTDYGQTAIRNNVVFGNGGSFLLQTMVRPARDRIKDPIVAIAIDNNLSDASDFKASMPFRVAHGGHFTAGSMEIVNNILITRRRTPPFACMVVDVPYAPGQFKCDYNHYYPAAAAEDDAVIGYQRQMMRMSQWKGLGWDVHSIGYNKHWRDPMFIKLAERDYHLSPRSPDVAAGANLSSSFTGDNENLSREKDGAWDIGPFRSGEVESQPSKRVR